MALNPLIKTALDNGYSWQEIADNLGRHAKADVSVARENGYSDEEIAGKLADHLNPFTPELEPQKSLIKRAADTIDPIISENVPTAALPEVDRQSGVDADLQARQAGIMARREAEGIDQLGTAGRYAHSFAAGAGAAAGSGVSYIGRKFGIKALEDIGAQAQDVAAARTPANQTFGEQVMGGAGSIATALISSAPAFLVAESAPVVAGIAGVAKWSPSIARGLQIVSKWAPAALAGSFEAAGNATQTYDDVLKKTGNADLAQEQADKTFLSNLPVNVALDKFGIFGEGGSAVRKIFFASGAEGAQEGIQQGISNYFAGNPVGEGVTENAAVGAAVGGAVKTAGIMVSPEKPAQEATPEDVLNAETLDEAIAQAERLALPSYAGPSLVTFPDGSTMTGIEAEQYRLDQMKQPVEYPAAEPIDQARVAGIESERDRLRGIMGGMQERASIDEAIDSQTAAQRQAETEAAYQAHLEEANAAKQFQIEELARQARAQQADQAQEISLANEGQQEPTAMQLAFQRAKTPQPTQETPNGLQVQEATPAQEVSTPPALTVKRNGKGALVVTGNSEDVRASEARIRNLLPDAMIARRVDHDGGVSLSLGRSVSEQQAKAVIDTLNQERSASVQPSEKQPANPVAESLALEPSEPSDAGVAPGQVGAAAEPRPASPVSFNKRPDGTITVKGFTQEQIRTVADTLGARVQVGSNGNAIFGKGTDLAKLKSALGAKEKSKPRGLTGNLRNDLNILAPGLYSEVSKGGDGEGKARDMSLVAEYLQDQGYVLPEGRPSDAVVEMIRQDFANGGGTVTAERQVAEMSKMEQVRVREEALRLAREYGVETQEGIKRRPYEQIEEEVAQAIEHEVGIAGKALAAVVNRAKAAGVTKEEVETIARETANDYIGDSRRDAKILLYRETAGKLEDKINAIEERSQSGDGQSSDARQDQGAPGDEDRPELHLQGQTAAEARAETVEPEITREQIDREATAPFTLQQESQPSRDAVTGGQGGLFTPDGRPAKQAADRRHDTAQRKRIEHMTADEMRRELLTDSLTGIGNRRAYEEADKLPVQVSIDADSLKWINDNLGHPAGDQSLKMIADALRAETDQAFHLSGDEFVVQTDTIDGAERIMSAVQKRLDGSMLEADSPDGEKVTLTLGISYGTGQDLKAAERGLQAHKRDREVAGLRAARGEEPPSATRSPRGQGQETPVPGDQEEVNETPATLTSGEAKERLASEMTAADHLRAAAEKMEAPAKSEQVAVLGADNYDTIKAQAYKVASSVFGKDIYSEQIQNDWQRLLDAADVRDIKTLSGLLEKYRADLARDGMGTGTSGAGPAKVKQARRGAAQLARFALELRAANEQGEPAVKESLTAGAISDFGEKIGGARKDVWSGFKDKIAEVSDDEIANQPFSKVWPEPDYQAMLDAGADPWTVGFMHAARDEVPSKPRVGYKVRAWAEKVKILRDMTSKLLSGEYSTDVVKHKIKNLSVMDRVTGGSGLKKLASRIELYELVGHAKSIAGISFDHHHYSLYRGRENVSLWVVEKEAKATAWSNWPSEIATGDTKEEALAAFKARYAELNTEKAKAKEASFDIYAHGRAYYVGKKVGRNIMELAGPFQTVKEARGYRTEHQAELAEKLEKRKEIPQERRDTNNPRVGEDMREGKDVTPKMFGDAFGFRGVEFGNWVEQGKRQSDLNEAYDALMDMAAILGVPPKALSLNGQLGLAFGARGTGGIHPAKAHYEPGKVVINLTKKEGAGSLGHEWWHALDNYFSRMRARNGDFMTDALDVSLASRDSEFVANTAVRKEMVAAFGDVVKAIKNTALKARSSKLDAKRSKEYWTTGPEMSARAFESYLISKLQDQNASNDYLANIVDEETWKAAEKLGFDLDESYPYPTAGEVPVIRAAFDHFFQTVQTRETDKGIALESRGPTFYSQLARAVEQAPAKIDNGPAAQWKAWLLSNAGKLGVKKDEIQWTGITDWLNAQKGKVSKADIAEYLRTGGVQVEEVMLSDEKATDYADFDEWFRSKLPRDAERFYAMPEGAAKDDLRGLYESNYQRAVAGGWGRNKTQTPKFASYQLPGGENYRELLLTLPTETPSLFEVRPKGSGFGVWNTDTNEWATTTVAEDVAERGARSLNEANIKGAFKSGHFDQPNILAHIRFNERTDAEGRRVLFLEEIQSDWGQKGKKEGFKSGSDDAALDQAAKLQIEAQRIVDKYEFWAEASTEDKTKVKELVEESTRLRSSTQPTNPNAVPTAPFVTDTKAWTSLALKRMLRYAADNGFDAVAWTTGAQQAERYDLSKQIRSVEYFPESKQLRAFDLSGNPVIEETVEPEGIEEYIGKEPAKRLLESEPITTGAGKKKHTVEGDGLKVGGEGMHAYYDQILPQVASDVLKKVGAGKVENIDVPMAQEDVGGYVVVDSSGNEHTFSARWKAEKFYEENEGATFKRHTQPAILLTPEMKATIQSGLPLFSRGKANAGNIADIESVRGAFQKEFKGAADLDIRVVQSRDEIPASLRPSPYAEGVYHDGLGLVYLIADNLPTQERAAQVLLHEAVGHYGMASMMGDKFDPILRDVLRVARAKTEIKSRPEVGDANYATVEAVRMDYPEVSDAVAAQEVLARMAETGGKQSVFKIAVMRIRKWLREFADRLGLKMDFTEQDARDLVAMAGEYLRRGDNLGTEPMTEVAALASQSRVNLASALRRIGSFVDEFVSGRMKATDEQLLGKTPPILQALGAPDLDMHIDAGTVQKILGGKHRFQMTPEILKKIPNALYDPLLVFDDPGAHGEPGKFVVSEIPSRNGAPVVVAVHLGKMAQRATVNDIASAYGWDDAKSKTQKMATRLEYYRNEESLRASTIFAALDWANMVQMAEGSGHIVRTQEDIVNSGMESRSHVTGASEEGWKAADMTKLDDLIYSLQDKQVDTRRTVEAIRKASGDIEDKWNPYLQEELFHGRAAKGVKDFLDLELKPLLTEMKARGVELSDFEEYLWNRHAEERNQQIAKINPEMPDGGSGLKTADARKYLAGLAESKRKSYEALAKRIDAINANTRKVFVESGLEKAETIQAWEGAYKNYVPLQREDVETGGIGTGKGYSVRGSSTKRAMGSGRPVADILANIAQQRERAIVRAEKNRVSNALLGLAIESPNPDFWKVDEVPKERVVETRGGQEQVVERPIHGFASQDNVVSTRINGEDHFIVFNESDPRAVRMAAALKNIDADQLGRVLSVAGKMTRYFASINTQYNPIFGVINLFRDTQGAMLNLSTTKIAGEQKKVLGYTVDALRGIYSDLRAHRKGEVPSSSWAQLWEEFQKEGGQTGYRDQYADAATRTEAIEKELRRVGEGKAKGFGRAVFNWLSDYNETMENAVRLAAYRTAKESGVSNQQAASLAKNLTVNFNRKGQAATQIGALYAFFNASVQGTARMAETLTGPTGKKIVAGGILLGSMQAMLFALAGYDDDEPPEFVRERALILPMPDGKYISIPMPLGFHVLPNLGRIPTEFVMGGFKNPGKRISDLLGLLTDTFNPIGNAGVSLQTIAPTVIDPLAALAENRDWTGKPIAKTNMNPLSPKPGHLLAKDTASEISKAASYWINVATGGTKYKPGMISPTPDQIDYLIGQATGGVGREYLKAEQTVSSAASGEEMPLYKIPLVGRFIGDTAGQSAEGGRFYENLKRINEHEAEINGLRMERDGRGLAEYLRDNPESRFVKMANTIERQVSKLREQKRMALERDNKEMVRLIDKAITARMKTLNDAVRSLQERSKQAA